MRYVSILVFVICGSMAAAHPGHWAEVAGHDHWLAAGALAAAAAIALALLLAKGRKSQDDAEIEEAEPEDEDAPQEA